MKVNYNLIGKHIKEIRSARGFTQAALAEKIDVSTPFMSKIERGIKHPSLETLIRIASSLGTTIDVLLLGNQSGDWMIHQRELGEIMKGCSNKEQEFIMSVVRTVKSGIDKL